MRNNQEQRLAEWIVRLTVPRGHRPATCQEIDRLLETVDATPFEEAKVQRILAKAKGLAPVGERRAPLQQMLSDVCDAQNTELLALHRSKGSIFSQPIQAKLESLRNQLRGNGPVGGANGKLA